MGWSGGTKVFDAVAELLFVEDEIDRKLVLKALMSVLGDMDWDTEYESEYFEHPLVQEIYRELYPHLAEELEAEVINTEAPPLPASLEPLPALTETQTWCCSNGCGDTTPVQREVEVSRVETPRGKLIHRTTEMVWASSCCKAPLDLWDESVCNFVPWEKENG